MVSYTKNKPKKIALETNLKPHQAKDYAHRKNDAKNG